MLFRSKIIVWSISIFILIYGIFLFVNSIIKFYSIEDLYNEIIDLDPAVEHPFNIILIKNNQKSGKYLVFKSKRWNCWLFPNYHCKVPFEPQSEILHIKEYLQRDLNAKGNISVKYIGNELSIKMSVPNKYTKKYNFHYFIITEINIPAKKNCAFYYNGKKYNWKTIDQMYRSKNILKKNKDVLDYVRKNCELS